MASRKLDDEDIKLWLTEEEVERIIFLLDNARTREGIDKRLARLLSTQLLKYKDLRGGTNAELERPIQPKQLPESGEIGK